MSEKGTVEPGKNYLGLDAVITGRRDEQPPKAGRRVLRSNSKRERNPLTYVENGNLGGIPSCEQDFRKESSSYIWKEYKREKVEVRGVLLDNNMLIWFPSSEDISSEDISKFAREKNPDSQIVATFRFSQKPSIGKFSTEIVLKSRAKGFDSYLDPLVNYFGRSLGWQEEVGVLIFNADQRKQSFQGSLQAYLTE